MSDAVVDGMRTDLCPPQRLEPGVYLAVAALAHVSTTRQFEAFYVSVVYDECVGGFGVAMRREHGGRSWSRCVFGSRAEVIAQTRSGSFFRQKASA